MRLTRSFLAKRKQSGLSLIELLIAMFVGLFLLVGITTSYLSSKKSSIVRNQYSTLEDNGRIALELMSDTIKHAGYTSTKGDYLPKKFISNRDEVEQATCGVNSVKNPAAFPETITTDDITYGNGDGIGVIYLGDDRLWSDCAGLSLPKSCRVESNAPTNAARIYNAFYVDAKGNLNCVGSRAKNKVTIAEGIEEMQILYGVDVDGNSIVDSYLNANAVEDAGLEGLWSNIISVQIAILAKSKLEVKENAESESFTLLDTVYSVSPADKHQRAVFSTTISLRNSIH